MEVPGRNKKTIQNFQNHIEFNENKTNEKVSKIRAFELILQYAF